MALMFSKRVGRSLLVLFLVTVAVVGLLSLAPGSVADVVLGENATPEAVAAMNAKLGLDQPLWRQYMEWLGSALHGDLGSSPLTGQDVTQAILDRLPVTIELAVMGLLLGVAIAVVLAVIAAATQGSAVDRAISAVSSGLLAVPAFIAGPVLIYFLGLQLGWFPVSGWSRISDGLWENLDMLSCLRWPSLWSRLRHSSDCFERIWSAHCVKTSYRRRARRECRARTCCSGTRCDRLRSRSSRWPVSAWGG